MTPISFCVLDPPSPFSPWHGVDILSPRRQGVRIHTSHTCRRRSFVFVRLLSGSRKVGASDLLCGTVVTEQDSNSCRDKKLAGYGHRVVQHLAFNFLVLIERHRRYRYRIRRPHQYPPYRCVGPVLSWPWSILLINSPRIVSVGICPRARLYRSSSRSS